MAREVDELRVARCLTPVATAGALVDRLVVVAQRRRRRGVARILRDRRRRAPRYRWVPDDVEPAPVVVDLVPAGDDLVPAGDERSAATLPRWRRGPTSGRWRSPSRR